jgi:hypothetical protein
MAQGRTRSTATSMHNGVAEGNILILPQYIHILCYRKANLTWMYNT